MRRTFILHASGAKLPTGVYWRADADDVGTLDGRDDKKRAALIAERLAQWKSVRSA